MYFNISPKLILTILLVIVIFIALEFNLTIVSIICSIVIISMLYDWYIDFSHVDYFEDECGYAFDNSFGNYPEYDSYDTTILTPNYKKYQPKPYTKTTYQKSMPLKIQTDILRHLVPNMSFEIGTDENGEKRTKYKKMLEMSDENLASYITSLAKKEEKVEEVKATTQVPTINPSVNLQPQKQSSVSRPPLLLEAPKKESVNTVIPKVSDPPSLHTFIVVDNTRCLSDIKERIYNTIIIHLRNLYLSKNVLEIVLNNILYIDIIRKNTIDITHEVVIYVKDFKVFHNYGINFDIIIDKIVNLSDVKLSVTVEKFLAKTISDYYKEKQ